jgi:hypothetical protein
MRQEPVRGPFITAADVAERAEVSRSAISCAFTPGASVSEEVVRVFSTLLDGSAIASIGPHSA